MQSVRIICKLKEQTLLDCGEDFADLLVEDSPRLPLQMQAEHFIQVNAAVNKQMIEQAVAWLAPNKHETVRDFFCGLGNFTLPLAIKSAKVLAYEASQSMVEQARQNAHTNSLDNIQFEAMDLSNASQLAKLNIQQEELILLDPSREGALALCEYLLKQKPRRIVYVSCNPNTLTRDLKILSARYTVHCINVLDMFPFTQHLETMVLLELK